MLLRPNRFNTKWQGEKDVRVEKEAVNDPDQAITAPDPSKKRLSTTYEQISYT
jgi:hypothetical protein